MQPGGVGDEVGASHLCRTLLIEDSVVIEPDHLSGRVVHRRGTTHPGRAGGAPLSGGCTTGLDLRSGDGAVLETGLLQAVLVDGVAHGAGEAHRGDRRTGRGN